MLRFGERRSCGSVEAYLRPVEDGGAPRIGVVVPKHGRTIVERNRLQRRLREMLRTSWLPLERERRPARDLLLRARPVAYERSFAQLRDDLQGCLKFRLPQGSSSDSAC